MEANNWRGVGNSLLGFNDPRNFVGLIAWIVEPLLALISNHRYRMECRDPFALRMELEKRKETSRNRYEMLSKEPP